jgi:hypothetical protein
MYVCMYVRHRRINSFVPYFLGVVFFILLYELSPCFNKGATYTYYSLFIPEGVAEASQIFLRDAQIFPKLLSYENTGDVTGG